ncbi:amidohydrolase family protein [Rhizobium lentis]|uniref:amidohydrolase family protein n=1 Tax=Rhizobium TaxID=379 RepID=UPI001C83769A|nr:MULTISPECIES: amidohydrolase family protein [Rhizobium]MBX5132403.1 amidohydrolase family protein [Rhizobium lentis]MBX5177389.1 amidohydrolase family protein [Rhizobium lentis]MBX5213691.1 amidohydrolase family protein [Rhizobium sp. NLR9a]MBX5219154.1 amidohydrolase family protein [Rhizobium sp. NLR8a]MBX5275081.1 amidohydrolase family protein [Rhizobium sp. NLR13a]
MDVKAIIDPHHHLWDLENYSYPWLCQPGEPVAPIAGSLRPIMKTYLLDDYMADAKKWNVVKDVHLDALSADIIAETKWLQDIKNRTGKPNGFVAHADLEAPDVDEVLAAHAKCKDTRGIRQILNWHPDPKYTFNQRSDLLTDPHWLKGYKLLKKYDFSFDLQLYPHQMPAAAKVAADNPETIVNLNHTGMPLERDDAGVQLWRDGMRSLARSSNVNAKISGLGMVMPDWTVDTIRPFVLETIEIFGVDRCMFASNFPVDKIYASFDRIYEAFFEIVSGFSSVDKQKLFHDNAQRIYRL